MAIEAFTTLFLWWGSCHNTPIAARAPQCLPYLLTHACLRQETRAAPRQSKNSGHRCRQKRYVVDASMLGHHFPWQSLML